jgi:peptidoglycan/xylan/chitin deacetylase (PgdA/CDA1 family)
MSYIKNKAKEEHSKTMETMRETTDLCDLGLPIQLLRPVRVNLARTVAEGVVRPVITAKELTEELTEITALAPVEFRLPTRVFEFHPLETDHVVARDRESDLPLVVRRGDEVIVNFDIRATQAFTFSDSRRPVYTYVPGFNIQKVPTAIRRPLSNIFQSASSLRKGASTHDFSKLPLTGFEFVILLLNRVLATGSRSRERAFRWPSGKRAVFVSLHDVDTGGFLRRKERDLLFRLEQKHQIRSTWFMPTAILGGGKRSIDFLLQSESEVGWHGHKHDHRLPFKPFANHHVRMLGKSFLAEPENFPTGMRSPKLMKSNYLFDVLERSCPALCYDTSFSQGIVPYYLWVNGRQSKILEIPITVPTDIGVYNKLHGIPRSGRGKAILEAQIARTERLMEVGAVISIVTHPEKDLSERPDFMEIYDQYLSYIKSRPDIWFATAGELFKYWTGCGENPVEKSQCSSGVKSGREGER